MIDDVLGQLVGGPPRKLLDDLARIGAALATNDRARPEAELLLTSGQTIRGRVVSTVDGNVVVHVGGHVKQPAVTFVRVDQVAAISVADASLLVRAPVSDAPVPSRLELSRQLAARLDGLTAQLGHAIEIGLGANLADDDRRAIGALVPILFEVLGAIAGDDMGKQALGGITRVELAAGASGEVTKESGGFSIRAPKLITEQFTHQTLRRALEKQL